ncbi:MAG: hypothetical protein ACP5K8_07420 [Nitrososphaeria archaeon]
MTRSRIVIASIVFFIIGLISSTTIVAPHACPNRTVTVTVTNSTAYTQSKIITITSAVIATVTGKKYFRKNFQFKFWVHIFRQRVGVQSK